MTGPVTQTSARTFTYRLAHFVYRLAWRVAGPFVGRYLGHRTRIGKEDETRLLERRGVSDRTRPDGRLLLVHGASVGESLSALPLIERLLSENTDLSVLVTTGTVTSAKLLKERLPERAFHQYIPLDHPGYVARFLDHWKPDVVFWLESEFWPVFLEAVAEKGIPSALINARMSEKSFASWLKRPGLIAPLLGGFDLALAQDESVAEKLATLGAGDVRVCGNLKFAVPPLQDNEEVRRKLQAMIGNRSVIIGAQTAPGEEEILARIHLHLSTKHEGLLTILAPRHVERAEEILEALEGQGLEVSQRSRGQDITETTDIYLADTMGELGVFYRLDAPVFLGRSLVPGFGGSNALEPAILGRAILQGPHTENFKGNNDILKAGDATLEVRDDLELCNGLDNLLQDKELAAVHGTRAREAALSAAHVLDDFMVVLTPLISDTSPRETS